MRMPRPRTYDVIMMTSGSPGITSTTLDSSESASSLRPPRKPPTTPTRMDSAVAATATTRPMVSDERVATTICRSTSWPVWVVPSQCWADGGASSSPPISLALPTRNGPTTATRTKNPTMPPPSRSLPDGRGRHRRGVVAGTSDRPAPTSAPTEMPCCVVMVRPQPLWRVLGSMTP
jgi:predicted acylesterase/phospholipase RssA